MDTASRSNLSSRSKPVESLFQNCSAVETKQNKTKKEKWRWKITLKLEREQEQDVRVTSKLMGKSLWVNRLTSF